MRGQSKPLPPSALGPCDISPLWTMRAVVRVCLSIGFCSRLLLIPGYHFADVKVCRMIPIIREANECHGSVSDFYILLFRESSH